MTARVREGAEPSQKKKKASTSRPLLSPPSKDPDEQSRIPRAPYGREGGRVDAVLRGRLHTAHGLVKVLFGKRRHVADGGAGTLLQLAQRHQRRCLA